MQKIGRSFNTIMKWREAPVASGAVWRKWRRVKHTRETPYPEFAQSADRIRNTTGQYLSGGEQHKENKEDLS